MRVSPTVNGQEGEGEPEPYGWFVAERGAGGGGGGDGARLVLAYSWERDAFPWLMTWEENYGRDHAPWSSRTLCRGLEFGATFVWYQLIDKNRSTVCARASCHAVCVVTERCA